MRSIVFGCWVDHACSNRHCPSIMTTIGALTDHTIMSLSEHKQSSIIFNSISFKINAHQIFNDARINKESSNSSSEAKSAMQHKAIMST